MGKGWTERVKSLLSKEDGSIEALASKLGVSFFTVLRWKNGQRKPSKMAQKLISDLEEKAGPRTP